MNTSKLKLNVGIVGCGLVTQVLHLPSLYQLPESYQVRALCDVSPTVLNEVAEQWNVTRRYSDYQELMAQDDIDVVLVANPDVFHTRVVLAAIHAGKHVLVEKPMCVTVREAEEIISAQRAANTVVQVAYMRRYAPAFERACVLARDMEDIQLARVHAVIGGNNLFLENTTRVIRGDDLPPSLLEEAKALQGALYKEAIGNAPTSLQRAYQLLLGLSSHDLSAMRELLGSPKGVIYAAQRSGGRYLSAAFDYGAYVCQFETGINAIPCFDSHLEVYSAKRIIKVQYNTPFVRNLPVELTLSELSPEGGVMKSVSHPAWGDPFVAEWQAFYSNVMEGLTPKTDPADALQDLKLFQQMMACMKREQTSG
jgi:predicted dehydrogenase